MNPQPKRTSAGEPKSSYPYLPVFPGDWLQDGVSGCSLAAQGLWLRLMFVMKTATPYGHLAEDGHPMRLERILRQTGATKREYLKLLDELTLAGVPRFSGNDEYRELTTIPVEDAKPLSIGLDACDVIYSRRMVKDHRLSIVRSLSGVKGGSPLLLKQTDNREVNPPSRTGAGVGLRPEMGLERSASSGSPEGGPGETAKAPLDFTGVSVVMAAYPEGSAPHPGVMLEWIKRLGSADAVAQIVRKYPGKPVPYITAVIESELSARKAGHSGGSSNAAEASLYVGATFADRGLEAEYDRLTSAVHAYIGEHGKRAGAEWDAAFTQHFGFTPADWKERRPEELLETLRKKVVA